MNWLNKLDNRKRYPAGMEWKLFRRMPRILLIGTLLPALVALALRLFPWAGSRSQVEATLGMLDYVAIGVVILHWTVVLTLTIGCVIVMLMKGPAYVADAYPLIDADRPARDAN